jgi:hypothetical protein
MFRFAKPNSPVFGRCIEKPDISVCQIGQSGFWLMHRATIYSIEPSSSKPDGPIF